MNVKRAPHEEMEAVCSCCGDVYISDHRSRKYCDRCRCVTEAERKRIRFAASLAAEAERPSRIFVCEVCGKEAKAYSSRQKYCVECRDSAYKQLYKKNNRIRVARKSQEAATAKKTKYLSKEERLLDCHDLKGKSLARVDAEAKAFGLSYGQYTAAVYSGGIDQLLKSRGFNDPVAVLRDVKVK